jgi:hypothetical protein
MATQDSRHGLLSPEAEYPPPQGHPSLLQRISGRRWGRKMVPFILLGTAYATVGIFALLHYKEIIPALESLGERLREAGIEYVYLP